AEDVLVSTTPPDQEDSVYKGPAIRRNAAWIGAMCRKRLIELNSYFL
ncbi:hypothetical protein Tco_1161406, partial [Tanacetum coccineum]